MVFPSNISNAKEGTITLQGKHHLVEVFAIPLLHSSFIVEVCNGGGKTNVLEDVF
jgi:hypothetical protein